MDSTTTGWGICRIAVAALALPLMTCRTRSQPTPSPPTPSPPTPSPPAPSPLASSPPASAGPQAPVPKRVGRVIFDEALARERWAGLLPDKKAKFWTPSTADVLALEGQLPDFLLSQPEDSEARKYDLWFKAPRYPRQYVGITRKGRRIVYANFFCFRSKSDPDWHVWPVDVDDGGACYFQVEYDVESGQFSRLSVNGSS